MGRDVVASQEIVSLNTVSEHQRIEQQKICRTLKYFNLKKIYNHAFNIKSIEWILKFMNSIYFSLWKFS